MENNNTKKTNYQILLEKLNDEDFAERFFDLKQKEAEGYLGDIFMVTSGVCHTVKEGKAAEWGHERLHKIFEMFQIRHENFDRAQLAENLQQHIFSWTDAHFQAQLEWQKPFDLESTLGEEIAEITQATKEEK